VADILSISSSAVGVYQRVLGVVSNNIANVGNADYVKQDASLGQTPPTFDGRNFMGTGAVFDGVQRQYNAFIETTLRNATANLAGQNALVSYANRVVDFMASGEIGLSPALDRFFSAARNLSADPASPVARNTFLREVDGVASRFRDLSTQLQQVEAETQQAMKTDLAQVNALAAQLGTVNLELSRLRSLDRQPPTLLDQRDKLLRQISDRINISVTQADNGVVTVTVGGAGSAGALVAGSVVKPLAAEFDSQAPERIGLLLDPFGGTPVSISGVSSGSFGGLSALRSQVLDPAFSNLDLLAKAFMTEVNRIHTEGVDANGDAGKALYEIRTAFSFERILGTAPMNTQAKVTDLKSFDGKDITVAFNAEAGQVYTTGLIGPFQKGDRIEVSLNGLSKVFSVGNETSRESVTQQLRQFIDGTFGVQLRAQVDPTGQVVVNSSVMKTFSFDVKISSELGRVQIDRSQGLWEATDRNGERITGVSALTVRGVTVTLKGNPVNGEQVVVRASSRPAAGLYSLQSDPKVVAAASSFRAVRGVDNLSTGKATVLDQISQGSGDAAAPLLGTSGGLANNPVVSGAKVTSANRALPFATIPGGVRDVAVYLDPGQNVANLQILTRDGRHLLGTTLTDGASFVSNAASVPAPFQANSTYSAEYLNQRGTAAYRGLSMFYGARAKPTEVQVLGVDHVPTSVQQRPARLQAELTIPTGTLTVPANSLVLNGVTLPVTGGAVNRPEDVAAMLNTAIQSIASSTTATAAQKSAVDGVSASVKNGILELTRPVSSGPAGQQGLVEFGFSSPAGDTQLMARMGFRTAAYLDGAIPEDLLVFTTGSGDVKIAAAFSGNALSVEEQRQQMRANPLRIQFTAADRYRIVDTTSNTVLADRAYTAGAAISYRGLRIQLSAAPRANDTFVVSGNQDGLGDNGNGLRFVELEKKGITGPGNTMSVGEAYLNVVDQITNVAQQAKVATTALEVMHKQAIEARESVSGVSLDEEAANLIRFQQAYQAAAKSMQVASQMFDSVLRI